MYSWYARPGSGRVPAMHFILQGVCAVGCCRGTCCHGVITAASTSICKRATPCLHVLLIWQPPPFFEASRFGEGGLGGARFFCTPSKLLHTFTRHLPCSCCKLGFPSNCVAAGASSHAHPALPSCRCRHLLFVPFMGMNTRMWPLLFCAFLGCTVFSCCSSSP